MALTSFFSLHPSARAALGLTAGIPKRNSNESRPIAVASVFVRLWHRVLLQHLPSYPDQRWFERGVVKATQRGSPMTICPSPRSLPH